LFLTHLPKVILIPFLLVTTGIAWAGDKVDRTLDADFSGSLFIDNTRGALTIVGWDKPQIQLKGELDDSARKLIFKRKGNKALIKVVMKGMSHGGQGSELKVFVPRDTHLRIKGVDTTFSISDLTAKLEGQTINGDLIVSKVHSKMNISSVSGKVKVSESSGYARIESVSGKVDFSGAFTEARIRSMSGNIMANIDGTHKLSVENGSGSTAINGHLLSNAHVKLSSISGDIHYRAVGKFNAECQIASRFGGKIRNRLTEDKPWDEKMKQRKLEFTSGDGSGKLVMNTISGSVTLEK
jgi:hypothetical protein